jgi:epoxyqueuosine reductase
MRTQEDLKKRLKEHGFEAAIVSARHVDELRSDLMGHVDSGSIDADFYKERLSWFDFKAPENPLSAASLIVVAVPRPQTRVTFRRNGGSLSFIIPPTYSGNEDALASIRAIIAGLPAQEGFGTIPARLPNKLLAVRSGLAEYGRNNVAYVQGMGSFHELIPLYSDLPCEEDGWREAAMMKACETCRACTDSCPTGAIDAGRFLLHAERCLVYLNEREIGFPFPSWVDPSWHECPVGCMKCQRVCPKNRAVLGFIEEGADFSAEETELLLAGTRPEDIGEETMKKLKRVGMADYLEVMPRNLSVLFGIF